MPDKDTEITFSFESALREHTQNKIDNVEKEVDIITFAEHEDYLDQPLHPVEKMILKVYYGLPLDNKNKYLKIRSYPHDGEGKMMTEVEYCQFLVLQGRTNLLDPFKAEATKDLVLPCGRRSGKTFICSIISAYEAYKLIVKDDPQKHYELPRGQDIRIVNIATNSDQALVLAKATQDRILHSKWFLPYIESKNQSTVRLRTKSDLRLVRNEIETHGKALDSHASIIIEALSCTARGIRGMTVIVAILDEIAYFMDNEGNRSGDAVYEALTPSIATFGNDGKILSISSPDAKQGIFHDLFIDAKGTEEKPSNQTKRMFQIPTWEMNEKITFSALDDEKNRNPERFNVEFGAEFSSIISGFFRFPEKIDDCIKNEDEAPNPAGKFFHYIAVDPSASEHGYALAMVHVETRKDEEKKQDRKIVVLDRWKMWSLKDPEFEGEKYIDPEIIDNYIEGLHQKFRIGKLVYDQFDSTASVMKFKKMGIDASKTPFSRPYNMKIYSRLRGLIYEGLLELFPHELGIKELKHLQEKRVGKKQFVVQAPTQGDIMSDDMADVLANASYIASESEGGSGSQIVGTNGKQRFGNTDRAISGITSQLAYARRKRVQHKFAGNYEKAMRARKSKSVFSVPK